MTNRNRTVGALGVWVVFALAAGTAMGQQPIVVAAPGQGPSPATAAAAGATIPQGTPADTAAPIAGATAPARGTTPQPNIWYSNSNDPRNAYGQPNIWYSNSTDPAITYGQPSIWYSNSTDPRTANNNGTVSWYSNSADPNPYRAPTAGSFAEQPPPVWINWSSTYTPATVSTQTSPAVPPAGSFVSPAAVTAQPVAYGFLTQNTPLLGGNPNTAAGSGATGTGVAPAMGAGTPVQGVTGTGTAPVMGAGTTTGVVTGTGVTPTGVSPVTPTGVSPVTPTGVSPTTPTGVSPTIPTGVSPTIPTGVSPTIPTGVSPTIPAGVSPTIPAGVSPTTPAGTAPAAAGAPQATAPTLVVPVVAAAQPGVGITVAPGAVSPAEANQPVEQVVTQPATAENVEQVAAHAAPESAPVIGGPIERVPAAPVNAGLSNAAPEGPLAAPAPAPVTEPGTDHAATAPATNVASRPASGTAPNTARKLGSSLTTSILKIVFVSLLGLSLCVAATGVIVAVAFGMKGGSRSQR